MPDARVPHPFWEPTEYKPPAPKQRLVTPRTVGPSVKPTKVKRNTGLKPEPPRPVPSQPYRPPPPSPPPRRGGLVQPRTIGPIQRRGEGDKARGRDVPKAEEHALRTEAREKFPDDPERQDAYVFGTMRKHGWRPEHHSPWDGKTYKHWYFGIMKV